MLRAIDYVRHNTQISTLVKDILVHRPEARLGLSIVVGCEVNFSELSKSKRL
jgi:hypothetical protein